MNQLAKIDNNANIDKANAASVIQRHSRSFSIASRLLPARVRSSFYALYAWCRTVDDAVDEASSDEAAEEILNLLDADLDRMRQGEVASHPASAWIEPLILTNQIEVKHAKELITGMRMDLQSFHVADEGDLKRYCYHAAGTVGLMLTRLMGVKDPGADRHAIALGVAMQLTNIARDVREDAGRGRCYLPGILNPLTADPSHLRTTVEHVLTLADQNYRLAADGIKYLNWDVRLGIRIASSLYREIGHQIRRNGYQVLHGRTVLSKPRLLRVLAATLFKSIADDLKLFSFSIINYFQENPMNEPKIESISTVAQAKHAVYLGLSLTAIMSAALFLIVFVNPKETSYSSIPLIYSSVSLICAALFNRLAARCEIKETCMQ